MKNNIKVILGRKGSGKSYLANQISKSEERIVIADPLDEYKGGHIFYSFDELEMRFNELYFRPSFRIVAKFTRDDDYDRLFNFLFNYTGFTLLIDETDMFASHNSMLMSVKRLISYGRHRSINLIMISRRPYELNRLVTAQADEIYTFRQTEKRDLEFMKSLGIDETEVFNLEKHKYIVKENE